MSNSDQILEHVQMPEAKRDLMWESRLLKMLPEASVRLLSDSPQEGPDGFPYLVAELNAESNEPIKKVADWLSTRGIGLVINPQKQYPDYIFTYGMIWNFALRGEFLTDSPIQADKVLAVDPTKELIAGPPHDQYLPVGVRNIMRQFFIDQGVFRPRIVVIGQKNKTAASHFDLCFSLESLGQPEAKEHEGLLKTISWFLPAHYSIALLSEKEFPQFVDL